MQLMQVPPRFVDKAWRDGAALLGEACVKACGEVTPDQLKLLCARGELILLALMDGDTPKAWAAVRIDQCPNLLALFVYAIYARNEASDEAMELLKDYARTCGCSRLRGACDVAVSRLWKTRFGMTEAYRVMEIEL